MYSALYQFLHTIKPVDAHERALFDTCLMQRSFPKQHVLLREGELCNELLFIVKGNIRAYHLKDGEERHLAFFFEHTFAADLESLTSQQPSQLFLETMEPTEVISCNREKMIALYREAPVFESIGRVMLEQLMVQQQQYSRLFTLYTPAERYAYIVEHHPELLQRVPLQFLASYLGIARETLSRIRRKSS